MRARNLMKGVSFCRKPSIQPSNLPSRPAGGFGFRLAHTRSTGSSSIRGARLTAGGCWAPSPSQLGIPTTLCRPFSMSSALDSSTMPASSAQSTPPLEFRKPELSDVPAIYDIVLNTGLDVNSPYAYMVFCTHFADEGAVATQDGQVVGFIKGYRPPSHPDTIFVWQVGVHPDKGGLGIGGKLLAYLADRMVPAGVKFVEATVTPDNAASRALFSGFARRKDCACVITDSHFKEDDFPQLEIPHMAEDLFRIGPYA